jgi:uncharacterized protein YndB with AHSA1/START domain
MPQQQVTRETVLAAGVEQVWDVVTVEVGSWLADEGELDPRVGGDGWFRDGDELRHAVVEDVVEGRRLAFRWWRLGEDGVGEATRVELALDAVEEQATRLVVVEGATPPAPLPPAEPAALAFAG